MGVGLQELLLHLRWDVHGFIFYRPCAAATATVSSQVPQSCRRCCFTTILPKRKLLCLSGAFLWSAPAGAKSHSLPSSPSVARSVGCSGIALHRLSTSYLSPRKRGRGVFLSQHLFCFPNADTQLWIQHTLESLSTAILSNGHGGSWWITPPAFDCMKAASQMHLWPLTPSSFSLLLFSLLHYFLLIFGYNLLSHVDMENK